MATVVNIVVEAVVMLLSGCGGNGRGGTDTFQLLTVASRYSLGA